MLYIFQYNFKLAVKFICIYVRTYLEKVAKKLQPVNYSVYTKFLRS